MFVKFLFKIVVGVENFSFPPNVTSSPDFHLKFVPDISIKFESINPRLRITLAYHSNLESTSAPMINPNSILFYPNSILLGLKKLREVSPSNIHFV